jgi:hypothetical protein
MHPWKANYRKPMGLNCRGTTVAKESLTANKTTQIHTTIIYTTLKAK